MIQQKYVTYMYTFRLSVLTQGLVSPTGFQLKAGWPWTPMFLFPSVLCYRPAPQCSVNICTQFKYYCSYPFGNINYFLIFIHLFLVNELHSSLRFFFYKYKNSVYLFYFLIKVLLFISNWKVLICSLAFLLGLANWSISIHLLLFFNILQFIWLLWFPIPFCYIIQKANPC